MFCKTAYVLLYVFIHSVHLTNIYPSHTSKLYDWSCYPCYPWRRFRFLCSWNVTKTIFYLSSRANFHKINTVHFHRKLIWIWITWISPSTDTRLGNALLDVFNTTVLLCLSRFCIRPISSLYHTFTNISVAHFGYVFATEYSCKLFLSPTKVIYHYIKKEASDQTNDTKSLLFQKNVLVFLLWVSLSYG